MTSKTVLAKFSAKCALSVTASVLQVGHLLPFNFPLQGSQTMWLEEHIHILVGGFIISIQMGHSKVALAASRLSVSFEPFSPRSKFWRSLPSLLVFSFSLATAFLS